MLQHKTIYKVKQMDNWTKYKFANIIEGTGRFYPCERTDLIRLRTAANDWGVRHNVRLSVKKAMDNGIMGAIVYNLSNDRFGINKPGE